MYSKGSQVKIYKMGCIYVPVFANSVDPDEMSHYAGSSGSSLFAKNTCLPVSRMKRVNKLIDGYNGVKTHD